MGLVMPWSMAVYIIKLVCLGLDGWIATTVTVADEIAHALRNRDAAAGSFSVADVC